MISKYSIYINSGIWVLMYFLCTIYLYYMGMKYEWNKMRFEKGLVDDRDVNPPTKYSKCVFNTKIYIELCNCLVWRTILLSTILYAGFLLLSPVYDIVNNPITGIKIPVTVFVFYAVFAGVTVEAGENSEGEQVKQKGMKAFLSIVYDLKKKQIAYIVQKEKEHVLEQIKNKLENWANNRGKADNIGILVLRMPQFIRTAFPDNIDEGIAERLDDLLCNVHTLYIDDDISLLDELKHIFLKECFDYGITLNTVAHFIGERQEDRVMSKEEIKQKLKGTVEQIRNRQEKRKLKKVTKEEVDSKFKLFFGVK